jgi:hypothetical protein
VAEPYNDENKTIISRMQQRRGLKQDLPQPLRPGEFGFTVDSQQLYIGADPLQAPAYNKTSVYENTTGAVEIAETITNNQILYFTFPFKKYAKGEPTGASNSFNWLPTSIRLTGVDTDPVFDSAVTNANNVKSIMTNDTFRATDLIVKRNSSQQEGNNSATYGQLVAQDYIFSQNSTDGGSSHNLTFRTTPQPDEELTISYYDVDAIIKVLSNRNGGGDGRQDGFYSGTSFPSFYTAYDVPAWDRIDPDLIQISDTSGSGFIGLEFKHIAPRAMGTSITDPMNLSGLCYLTLVTPGDASTDRLPTGNITQAGSLVSIPVSKPEEFSTTPPNNTINLGGANSWLTSNAWLITAVDEPNRTVTVDIEDFGYTHFPVSNVLVGTSASDITISGPLTEGIVAAGSADNGHFLKMITGNIDINDMFFRVKTYATGAKNFNGEIWANNSGTYQEITSFKTPAEVDAIIQEVQDNLTSYVNWGFGKFDGATVVPSTGNVVQVYSKFSNYNTTPGYANITVINSNTPAQISNGVKDINEFLEDVLEAQGEKWSASTQNTFFILADSGVTSNVTIDHYPNLKVDGSPQGIVPTDGFVQDNTLSFNLSGVTTLEQVVGTVNSSASWPLLQLVPGETDTFGNPNMIMLTLNPASTSVYTEFEIIADECGTAEKLGLTSGVYDESNTYKANLENWFADLLLQPDCPIINSVEVGTLYSDDPTTNVLIGHYELPFDETFQELTFASREEALAFNSVVNNLYFKSSTADIRGLVNIKSNLEIELKSGITIGDKTVTYVDMNGAETAIPKGPAAPVNTKILPEQWTDVVGASFNTSDYDSYVIEYTIREAGFESAPGDGYQRVGTMHIVGRQDFSLGTGDVVYQDYSSEMVDVNMEPFAVSSEGDAVPALQLRVIDDGVNVKLQSFNRMPTVLTMRFLTRRWNSLG